MYAHMHTYESYLRIMECDITSSDFTHKMHTPTHTETHTQKPIRVSGAYQLPGGYLTPGMFDTRPAEHLSYPSALHAHTHTACTHLI